MPAIFSASTSSFVTCASDGKIETIGDQHVTMTSSVIELSGNGPGSGVDTMGGPQGDQHITMSSSLVVESSDNVPVSTTMSTSTAMVVEDTPTAVQGTNRFNLPPVPANYSKKDYRQRVGRVNRVWMEEAKEEIDSLRTALS